MHETQAILLSFDQYLTERRLQFDAVVIGGAALNLLGVVSRLTKDCDILHPEIPKEIAEASRAFAIELRVQGGTLQDNWLNNGPASLAGQLLPRWRIASRPFSLVRPFISVVSAERICSARSYSRSVIAA
jgi:hypothetical protein